MLAVSPTAVNSFLIIISIKVFSSNLNLGYQKIVLRDLKKGMYFAEVLVNGKFKESFKIIVSY